MINMDNVPSDRLGAGIALAAMKGQLIELVEMLSVGAIKTDMEIDSWAWAKIKEIDDLMGGGDE